MLESRDSRGDTPLHICGWFGQYECAQLLLAKRATVTALNAKGQTPLHNAAWSGGPKVTELFIANGGDMLYKDRHGATPLHLASANAQTETLQIMMRNGARLDSRGEWGRTPLHMVALGEGDVYMAKFLIDRRANIESKDERNGDTVLHLASEFGKQQLVEFLIDHGARLDSANRDGDTPLHRAALTNQSEVAAVLLDRGAPAEKKRRFDGRNAFHVALANHNVETARKIYEHFRTVATEVDDCGDNGLHLACSIPYSDALHELVQTMLNDNSGFINEQNLRGETPLHIYCLNGDSVEILQLLLNKGASNSITNYSGSTPVEIADAAGKEDFVTCLLGGSNEVLIEARKSSPVSEQQQQQQRQQQIYIEE